VPSAVPPQVGSGDQRQAGTDATCGSVTTGAEPAGAAPAVGVPGVAAPAPLPPPPPLLASSSGLQERVNAEAASVVDGSSGAAVGLASGGGGLGGASAAGGATARPPRAGTRLEPAERIALDQIVASAQSLCTEISTTESDLHLDGSPYPGKWLEDKVAALDENGKAAIRGICSRIHANKALRDRFARPKGQLNEFLAAKVKSSFKTPPLPDLDVFLARAFDADLV